MDYKPWIEKYRPQKFNEIVLNEDNKILLKNIIKNNHFPNLLLYGPPGTGKTTTIINLIEKYHNSYNKNLKGLKIHLNASDDRGIDIIRNQINQFVNTKSMFGNGIKFVILDEVDYMTKSAQQALKYLLQEVNTDVRFCLICNYISRIDETLQNEFVRLRFNKLPESNIIDFLQNICKMEKIKITKKTITNIQKFFINDMRSMINYIQMNNSNINIEFIDSKKWNGLFNNDVISNYESYKNYILDIITKVKNSNIKCIIKSLINYIIRNKKEYNNKKILFFFEKIIHNCDCPDEELIDYFINKSYNLFTET